MGIPRLARAVAKPTETGDRVGAATLTESVRSWISPPRLLAISDGTVDARLLEADPRFRPWLETVGRLQGVAVLLREKHLDDRDTYRLSVAVRSVFRGTLLISARPDIAVAAGADGVHLPAAGLPVAAVRRRFRRLLVGVSTHSAEEVSAAFAEGADYVTFGPVFATPSKLRYGPPLGLERLAEVSVLGLPVLALGGVDAQRALTALSAGAHGVAGIRCFADREEAADLVRVAARGSRDPVRSLE
ncbi:MAG TPA: thiamine phosphate synthase [Thermoanaerobaculia bacterium]|nr:thiamine phosphate synthase [Thermoanaerobaculia bacterium]